MKKLIALLFLFVILCVCVQAQTNIELMDIKVSPAFKPDTLSGIPLPANELNVVFKINNATNASLVHVLIGTEQDAGNLFTAQADIISENNAYYVSYNQIQNQIKGYTAQMFIALTPQQIGAYTHVTLFVEDIYGQESNRLYFNK